MSIKKTLRLSAGSIVIESGKLLLVHHNLAFHGRDFLVAPGGGLEGDESFPQAAIRETREETGLEVHPNKILFVEDMVSLRKRVVKLWFLCSIVGGQLLVPREATNEGIIEARWYRIEDIKNRTVYPATLIDTDWSTFFDNTFQTKYIENRNNNADF
jgi:8-oxo-dGTP diphosphatase